MIDLHCHLLPGVDDGPRTTPEALALSKALEANGITTAVLTPHVLPGYFDNDLPSLLPVFELFRTQLAEAGIRLNVLLGGEIRLHGDVFEQLASGRIPTIGNLDGYEVLLLEFPDGQIPVGALSACRRLVASGMRPLLAHPERNKEVMADPARIKPFVDEGCLLQLTASSVVGGFGARALKTAHRLLASGMTAVVATDSHNLAHRPPLLREAREAIAQYYGLGVAHRLTVETPGAIVRGRLTLAQAT